MIKSKLFKNLLESVSDDDVIAGAHALGLGGVVAPDGLPVFQPANIDGKGAPQIQPSPVEPDGTPAPIAATPMPAPPPTAAPPSKLFGNTSTDIYNQMQAVDPNKILADINASPHGQDNGHSALHRFGSGLFKGIQAWAASGGQGGIAGLAGAALTGGVGSTASKGFYAGLEANQQKQDLQTKYNQAVANEKVQSDAALRAAQIDNIGTDNDTRRLQIENERKIAQERIEAAKQTAKDRISGQALTKLFGGKYFDPNNPAHAALAKQANLDASTLKGWDDRNPIEKQVAGVSYRLNRQTGAYEPTNLPADESKTVTDYKVQMPNGEVRTYKVTQKDAANFSTQMTSLGARLDQQESQFSRSQAQKRDTELRGLDNTQKLKAVDEMKSWSEQRFKETGKYPTTDEAEQHAIGIYNLMRGK